MRSAAISFPALGDWSVNPPSVFSLFGLTFHWYGIIIALGFLLAVLYCLRRCEEFGIAQDDLIDMLIFAVPSAIVCARLYYVIFNFSEFSGDLTSIFKTWEGGIAIYGGIIGAIIALILVCRHKKIPAGAMLDAGTFGLLIGQAVGRWGNFINREAFGHTTAIFARMGLTPAGGETIYVHPAFLYESLWNAAGFLALHIYSKKRQRKFDGQIFLMYVAWYGLGRLFIEGIRTDSLYLFNTQVRVSQLLAGLSLVAALMLFYYIMLYKKPSAEALFVNRPAEEPPQTAQAAKAASPMARDEAPADAIREENRGDTLPEDPKSQPEGEEDPPPPDSESTQ